MEISKFIYEQISNGILRVQDLGRHLAGSNRLAELWVSKGSFPSCLSKLTLLSCPVNPG